ncbi:hypothetical protein [Ottowia sp. VDI28]|uniref:hypothetical protein n=1 Tax=Ottowia sp. VDI28 TaxID=3133968 RepID=UPI003C2FCDC6
MQEKAGDAMTRDLKHRAAFEAAGETYVRVLAQRDDEVGREATAWLGEQQTRREEVLATVRDIREEKTLDLAREANVIAERSMKEARISRRVSIVSVIVAAIAVLASWFAPSRK